VNAPALAKRTAPGSHRSTVPSCVLPGKSRASRWKNSAAPLGGGAELKEIEAISAKVDDGDSTKPGEC